MKDQNKDLKKYRLNTKEKKAINGGSSPRRNSKGILVTQHEIGGTTPENEH